MRPRSAVPVLAVPDVDRTMEWYRAVLGCEVHAFPATPPTVFAILAWRGVEVFLQRGPAPDRPRTDDRLDVYFRVEDVHGLFATIRDRVDVLVEPRVQEYGDTEFDVRDPDGHRLVFGELVEGGSGAP